MRGLSISPIDQVPLAHLTARVAVVVAVVVVVEPHQWEALLVGNIAWDVVLTKLAGVQIQSDHGPHYFFVANAHGLMVYHVELFLLEEEAVHLDETLFVVDETMLPQSGGFHMDNQGHHEG